MNQLACKRVIIWQVNRIFSLQNLLMVRMHVQLELVLLVGGSVPSVVLSSFDPPNLLVFYFSCLIIEPDCLVVGGILQFLMNRHPQFSTPSTVRVWIAIGWRCPLLVQLQRGHLWWLSLLPFWFLLKAQAFSLVATLLGQITILAHLAKGPRWRRSLCNFPGPRNSRWSVRGAIRHRGVG